MATEEEGRQARAQDANRAERGSYDLLQFCADLKVIGASACKQLYAALAMADDHGRAQLIETASGYVRAGVDAGWAGPDADHLIQIRDVVRDLAAAVRERQR
jgi:hypothetical protein